MHISDFIPLLINLIKCNCRNIYGILGGLFVFPQFITWKNGFNWENGWTLLIVHFHNSLHFDKEFKPTDFRAQLKKKINKQHKRRKENSFDAEKTVAILHRILVNIIMRCIYRNFKKETNKIQRKRERAKKKRLPTVDDGSIIKSK